MTQSVSVFKTVLIITSLLTPLASQAGRTDLQDIAEKVAESAARRKPIFEAQQVESRAHLKIIYEEQKAWAETLRDLHPKNLGARGAQILLANFKAFLDHEMLHTRHIVDWAAALEMLRAMIRDPGDEVRDEQRFKEVQRLVGRAASVAEAEQIKIDAFPVMLD